MNDRPDRPNEPVPAWSADLADPPAAPARRPEDGPPASKEKEAPPPWAQSKPVSPAPDLKSSFKPPAPPDGPSPLKPAPPEPLKTSPDESSDQPGIPDGSDIPDEPDAPLGIPDISTIPVVTDAAEVIEEMEEQSPPLQPVTSRTGEPALGSFTVDITRKEYAEFSEQLSTVMGMLRFRGLQMGLMFGLGGVTVLMAVLEYAFDRRFDMTVFFMGLLLAAAGLLSAVWGPRSVRRNAEMTYEQQSLGGHSYFGFVTVYADRLEKHTDKGVVVFPLGAETLYLETRDMMLVMVPGTPTLVLPARCLQPRDADAVRRAVLGAVPAARQRIRARFLPQAGRPVEELHAAEDSGWTRGDSLRVDMSYERDEFISVATSTAAMGYFKTLPYLVASSLLTGLLCAVGFDLWIGVAVFVLSVGFPAVTQIMGARKRAGQLYDRDARGQNRAVVLLTGAGIWLRPWNEDFQLGQGLRIPWAMVTRAVERPDSFEFFARAAFLRIPKRCVEDKDGLRAFVDAHFARKSK